MFAIPLQLDAGIISISPCLLEVIYDVDAIHLLFAEIKAAVKRGICYFSVHDKAAYLETFPVGSVSRFETPDGVFRIGTIGHKSDVTTIQTIFENNRNEIVYQRKYRIKLRKIDAWRDIVSKSIDYNKIVEYEDHAIAGFRKGFLVEYGSG